MEKEFNFKLLRYQIEEEMGFLRPYERVLQRFPHESTCSRATGAKLVQEKARVLKVHDIGGMWMTPSVGQTVTVVERQDFLKCGECEVKVRVAKPEPPGSIF